MKDKKQFAQNKLFNFYMICSMLLLWSSFETFSLNRNVAQLLIVCGFTLTLLLGSTFTPYCYAFDRNGVSLCYLFLPNERYLWKDIRRITEASKSLGYKNQLFSLFFGNVFRIDGTLSVKRRFYMRGDIRRSFRARKLLEKHWDGIIQW